ncbi:tRNA 2-thiouridine(34) synthase MnmA [Pectinatus haikarae]|uniref:tRNA-specific 2-thiouridylase MnmA n=1 Tax=Pectinatus haikarae TaxID=349096 RepID=A0ABT9Y4B4_9FIRM|nr:tRNA 2-thiouridine(34) synthase MnmA [Pectinatus haikarae]MDQ0202350.1 tRNA-specific 2-thiouridylase [Pectinatus haikarae]
MEKKKVAVAMSGGVDSSTTAAILLDKGYDVFGVTMVLSDEGRGFSKEDSYDQLSSVKDARIVCNLLNIKHYVMDFKDIFKKEVSDYFIDEYMSAHTPNPCVRCNHCIKFGRLLNECMKLGADYMATGHYVTIEKNEKERYLIKRAADTHKDQSYVLYHLGQEALSHIIFPLSSYTKTQTREMAKKYNLPVANKKESQEICFIPNDDYKAYLQNHSQMHFKAGNIVDVDGNILGRHNGLSLYTVGQRKGLGIAAAEPLYVIQLNSDKNEVVVGSNKDVFSSGLMAKNLNWIPFDNIEGPLETYAQIRYGKNVCQATVYPLENNTAKVIFKEPQRAVTPGQSVVFYDDNILLGGGIITEPLK